MGLISIFAHCAPCELGNDTASGCNPSHDRRQATLLDLAIPSKIYNLAVYMIEVCEKA